MGDWEWLVSDRNLSTDTGNSAIEQDAARICDDMADAFGKGIDVSGC